MAQWCMSWCSKTKLLTVWYIFLKNLEFKAVQLWCRLHGWRVVDLKIPQRA